METTQVNPKIKSLSLKTTAKTDQWSKYDNVFVANSGGIDADNEIIPAGAWDLTRFEKNGPVLYQHRGYFEPNPDLVLARGEAFIDDGQLMLGITKWDTENDLAIDVKRKIDEDLINTVSVGFMEKSPGTVKTINEKPVYVYDNVELMEVSIVHIPADPAAVKVKSNNTIPTTDTIAGTQLSFTTTDYKISPPDSGPDINPPQPTEKVKSLFEQRMINKRKIQIELWLAENRFKYND